MEEVGAKLRGARTLRGMSIEDVAQVTKIPRATLIALETDDHGALPAPVFVRGFVRAYAIAVGLDPGPVVRSLEQRQRAHDDASGVWGRDTARADSLLPLAHAATLRRAGGAGVRNGYVLLVVIAAGLLLAAWLMVGGHRGSTTSSSTSNTATAPAIPVIIQDGVDGVSSISGGEGGGDEVGRDEPGGGDRGDEDDGEVPPAPRVR